MNLKTQKKFRLYCRLAVISLIALCVLVHFGLSWVSDDNGLSFQMKNKLYNILASGLAVCLVFGLVAGVVHDLTSLLAVCLALGFIAGLAFSLASGLAPGFIAGLAYGLFLSLTYGLASGLVCATSKALKLRSKLRSRDKINLAMARVVQ